MGPLPGEHVQEGGPLGAVGRLKALSARKVAAGGERGWWRWLVPALVVAVVLFAAADVRKASEYADSALSASASAEDFAVAAGRTSTLSSTASANPSANPSVNARDQLAASREELRSALAQLSTHASGDMDVLELGELTEDAERSIGQLLQAPRGVREATVEQVARDLSNLETLASKVASNYVSARREADADARRRLTWTVVGGVPLLGLLMWSFWARRNAADVARRERRFQALLQNSSDLVLVVDPRQLTVRYATPVIERMLGSEADDVVGTSLLDLAHPEDRDALAASLRHAADAGEGARATPWRARHGRGGWIDVEAICLDLADDASVRGTVVTVRDVGERNTLEERLRHQAFHDPLTGLPNRALFEDRVRHAVARARRHGRGLAVLFVDLDDFKTVNDSLGHAAGDDLLRLVAQRLDDRSRAADTVARLGGDEFAVLVEDPEGIGKAEEVAVRMHSALDQPFDISGHEIFVRSSIGIALADQGANSEELLRNADIAMYAAKASGKGRSEVFRPTMHMAARKRLELSGDLRRALRAGELTVQYQPLVDLEDERVLGVEALARWNHPRLGEVPPEDFIPIAEEAGLIVPLGRWILGEACHQVKRWQESRPDEPPIYVSVNVSARQFRQPGTVVAQVREATAESGVDPSLLVLEITESVLMQDRTAVGKELAELHELGVRVAIDDFGTGYSALSYLREFPMIDMVKMDQSFVNDLSRGAGDAALVRSVVELGEALDMQIVAEGIERRDQLDSLSRLNCGVGQGYFFARPLDAGAMDTLLEQRPRSADAAA